MVLRSPEANLAHWNRMDRPQGLIEAHRHCDNLKLAMCPRAGQFVLPPDSLID